MKPFLALLAITLMVGFYLHGQNNQTAISAQSAQNETDFQSENIVPALENNRKETGTDESAAAETSDEVSADSGNTSWMLTATALVLFMTLPGLALFYGGLVQSKNVLSVLMHCFSIACIASIIWFAVGYSLALTEGSGKSWIGGKDAFFLKHISIESLNGDHPETVWIMYQKTFAIITPALIVGAFLKESNFRPSSFSVDFGLCSFTALSVIGYGVAVGSTKKV